MLAQKRKTFLGLQYSNPTTEIDTKFFRLMKNKNIRPNIKISKDTYKYEQNLSSVLYIEHLYCNIRTLDCNLHTIVKNIDWVFKIIYNNNSNKYELLNKANQKKAELFVKDYSIVLNPNGISIGQSVDILTIILIEIELFQKKLKQ